jgi:hypothetical protein
MVPVERSPALDFGEPAVPTLLEASTESEWVAHAVEGLGHEVIVAVRTSRRCTPAAAGG